MVWSLGLEQRRDPECNDRLQTVEGQNQIGLGRLLRTAGKREMETSCIGCVSRDSVEQVHEATLHGAGGSRMGSFPAGAIRRLHPDADKRAPNP